jgi:predicted dinucleotide-utilizing enzyme
MPTIGLIGAGHIGSQLARLAVANGYDVVLSNSRGPDTLSSVVAELGPHARAATVDEAAKAGDVVVVTIPLKNYQTVPVDALKGKIVAGFFKLLIAGLLAFKKALVVGVLALVSAMKALFGGKKQEAPGTS